MAVLVVLVAVGGTEIVVVGIVGTVTCWNDVPAWCGAVGCELVASEGCA
ncbi:MAG TPA: hypothetical protein VK283_10980 [Acidimicrobiales bacterium]|nr:hypothetical protein [Acidimicrobiales bacterium]